MRYILLAALALPTLAQAHSGPHLHPHGIDAVLVTAIVLGVVASGVLIWQGRK